MSSISSGYGQSSSSSSFHLQHYKPVEPRWSLNDLSTELLALILEQVRGYLLPLPTGRSMAPEPMTSIYSQGTALGDVRC